MAAREHEAEEARIREAYARRQRSVSADRYALHRPAAIHARSMQLEHLSRSLQAERRLPFGDQRILEVGCGHGQWLVDFESMGARRDRLAGIDLDPERIAHARRRLSALRGEDGRLLEEGADLRVGSAAELPWADRRFDLVFQSTVFTSILDPALRASVAKEMLRVVRSDGLIVWYDFRFDNPFNRDVKGVGRREIAALFPGCEARYRSVTLMPPLARRLAVASRELATLLERLRFLNTHYLVTLSPPPA